MPERGYDPEYEGVDMEEEDSLIEMSSRGNGRRSRRHLGPSSSSGGSFRYMVVGFVVALIGVYYLGLHEGKVEVDKENREKPYNVFEHGGSSSNAKPASAPAPNEEAVQEEEEEEEEELAPKPTPNPTPRPTSKGLFTLDKLQATRAESDKLLKMLEDYYTSAEQTQNMLLKPWSAPWDFDSEVPDNADEKTPNHLRVEKIVDTIARALVTDEQKVFLMGAIGSSVAAGHDNCHYDSYESQMERLWGPVWEAAGMKFVFQNGGEGGGCGDSYKNQHYCIKQNVSPDVDIVQ